MPLSATSFTSVAPTANNFCNQFQMSDETDHIPFMRRQARTANLSASHRRSKKQEKGLAQKLGGRLTPASGAKDVKGDVRIKGMVRVEAKTTLHKSFSVSLDMIGKIEDAATGSAEMPVIVIEFHDGHGRVLKEVAVLPMYSLQTLIDNQS